MKKLLCMLLCLMLMSPLYLSVSAAEAPPSVPQIRVTTENKNGNELQKADGYVNASVTVTDTDGSSLSDDVSFKVRGNSTALEWVLKKSFTFKFSKKTDVLHMGKAKKWVLLANVFDPTLLRNYVGLDTAKKLDLPYTPDQRIVELWVDDSYRGCYTLTEPIDDGKDRVNIDTDSGDFIIEYESSRNEADVTYFRSGGLRFAMKEPDEVSDDELARVKGVMDDIVATLKTGVKDDIEKKIDVPSFVRYYLLNEYLKTVDFGFSSVFFFYQDDVLYAGPAWDYDLSAGNSNQNYSATAASAYVTDGLFADSKNIFSLLCACDWFNREAKITFEAYRDVFDRIGSNGGVIDTLYEEYRDVIGRNYSDAGWKPSKYWVNVQKQPLSTYEENLSYYQNWCRERSVWLTAYFDSLNFYLRGDSDGDDILSVMDATHIQKMLAHLVDNTDEMTLRRSRTSDESLSIIDATVIQRYLAGLSNSYRVNEAVKYEINPQ